jgi:hypothetical protein
MPSTNIVFLALYGAIMVLELGYPLVASGVRNNHLGRVRHLGSRYPAELMNTTSPASTAPQIARLTAARPRQIELADPSLATTAVKRQQLRYLIRKRRTMGLCLSLGSCQFVRETCSDLNPCDPSSRA